MSAGVDGDLPFIDVHSLAVDAAPEWAWDAVAQVMSGWAGGTLPRRSAQAGALLARLLGCADAQPPRPGPGLPEAMVGFHVAQAEHPSLIALEGEHRFSRYALTFRIEPADASRCVVKAETRAAFPGLAGRIYRGAVIGTGAHVFVVRRMLSSIKRRAERTDAPAAVIET
ncbi:MAG TPA: hypothetical protein VHS55_05275 [Solirubrobacteraceae bacterium]|jgi:hypothetical protein|nr:hypothetical protein [Solirubrobacteraceae bacterium]